MSPDPADPLSRQNDETPERVVIITRAELAKAETRLDTSEIPLLRLGLNQAVEALWAITQAMTDDPQELKDIARDAIAGRPLGPAALRFLNNVAHDQEEASRAS